MKNYFKKKFQRFRITDKTVNQLAILLLVGFSILTILATFEVLGVKTKYNLKQFFPKSHPLLRMDEQVKSRFDLHEVSPFLLIAKIPKKNPLDWSQKKYLKDIKNLTSRLKKIPQIVDVQNISTLQGANETEQGLGVGTVIDYLSPLNFKQELKTNAILSPLFLSKDARLLTMFISIQELSTKEVSALEQKILMISKKGLPFAEVSIGGIPAIQSDVNQLIGQEIIQFIIVAFFMSLLALSLIFSNFYPVMICTLSALVTNLISVWGISLFGFSFNILSSTIPILVTMTVISMSLHSILRLIEHSKKETQLSHQKIVLKTFKELLRPNLLTALTTSVGFFTLTLSDSPLIQEFGFSVGIALLVTWLNAALLLPALLILTPRPRLRSYMNAKARWPFFIFRFHKTILFSVVALSLWGALEGRHLSWNAKLFDDLPKNHQVRKTTELIDKMLGGLVPLDIEIRLPRGDNPWSQKRHIDQIEALSEKLRNRKGVGSVLSMADILKSSGLKKTSASVPEVMFILSMSSDNPLKPFLSSDGLSTRLSIRLQDIAGFKMWNLVQEIRKNTQEFFPTAIVKMAGTAAYVHDINNAMSKDLLYGFWQAMLVICILIIISYRSLTWALLACIPNLTPPSLLLGALALWKIPIKPGIAIILSISLGLAFNNTVYLLERLRQLMAKGWSYPKALKHTFWAEANSCFFSSLVLIVGFAAFAVSYFKMNQLFGAFMVLSVVTGLLGDLVLLPALLQFLINRGSQFLKVTRSVTRRTKA